MTTDEIAGRFSARQTAPGRWQAHCPTHDDRNPSLSIWLREDGSTGVKCYAGCSLTSVLAAQGLGPDDLVGESRQVGPHHPGSAGRQADSARKPRNAKPSSSMPPPKRADQTGANPVPVGGLTLQELGEAKRLPEAFLLSIGVGNVTRSGRRQVRIPYYGEGGEEVATRYRVSLDGEPRFLWQKGAKAMPYGLERLVIARQAGWVLLVEGESDCWTCWLTGVPALGVPGKTNWQSGWAKHLAGIPVVYVWQEPDAEDFTARILKDIPSLRVIPAPDGVKDPSAALCQGHGVPNLICRLRQDALPASDLVRQVSDARIRELESVASPALELQDPLELVARAMQDAGYAGDMRPPLLVYVAFTSRVLAVAEGAMLAHLILIGGPSSGKSWTVFQTTRLMPEEALHRIDAGSPRALIYDTAPLDHRALIFAEADSMPGSNPDEDSSAASAIRNLLQDNVLSYHVTERDARTGSFAVRHVRKPGPTVLITTAVRPMGEQLMTRLLVVEIADNPDHVLQALYAQANREETHAAIPPPPQSLIAMQSYLQSKAPWKVVVPFASQLAHALGRVNAGARLLRDFQKLLSLIKAVCTLRHRHRKLDCAGRLVAEIADYETVRFLAGEVYTATASRGVTQAIRDTVGAVAYLGAENAQRAPYDQDGDGVTVRAVAGRLGIDENAALKRIQRAITLKLVVNYETRPRFPARLGVGEPMPDEDGGLPALNGNVATQAGSPDASRVRVVL